MKLAVPAVAVALLPGAAPATAAQERLGSVTCARARTADVMRHAIAEVGASKLRLPAP